MLGIRLIVLSVLLCALAGQMAAQKFETINKRAGGRYVPTVAPNGDLYGTDASGLYQLRAPAQAGQRCGGFYGIGHSGGYGSADLICADSAGIPARR